MLNNGNHKFVPAAASIEVQHGTALPSSPTQYMLFRLDPPTAGSGLYWYSGAQWMKYCLPDQDFVSNEAPSGTLNGTNKVFTLSNTPVKIVSVYLNGLLQEAGAANDYTISGSTLTMVTAPYATDKLRVTYFK